MKNKGYYGWIHSLNEAGIQAQRNGFEILAEQRAHKAEMLNEANRSAESIAKQKEYLKNYSITRAAKNQAAREAEAAVRAANAAAREAAEEAAEEAANTPEESEGVDDASDFNFDNFQDRAAIVKAEGMKSGSGVKRPETGSQLGRQQKTPQTLDPKLETVPRYPKYSVAELARQETAELARLQAVKDSKPTDVNKDGVANANDVKQDARDGVINGIARIPLDAPPATQVHPEPIYKSFGEADWAAAKLNGYEDETDAARADKNLRRLTVPRRGSFTGPVTESVSQKISRIMNEGNKTVRGRIVTGGDSEIPARSPNSLDAPDGIFKGTESPSQKVGRILQIVNDGPEKHGEEIHSWASNALNTMRKQLRRN